MSRTYHKYASIGLCTGNNRDYYKRRRKHFRRKFKNNLRYLLSNFNIKDVSDLVLNPKYPKRDTWDEPTDGRHLYNKDIIKDEIRRGFWNLDWYKKICYKYLKFRLKKNN